MDDLEVLATLQAEAATWTKRNFPNQPAYHPLLGVVEEIGEMLEAKHAGNEAGVRDAFADVIIFVSNLCTHHDLSIARLWSGRFSSFPLLLPTDQPPGKTVVPAFDSLIIAAARVAHHRLKYEQKIRGNSHDHLHKMANALELLLACVDVLMPGVVHVAFKIWREEVQPRNWRSEAKELTAGT